MAHKVDAPGNDNGDWVDMTDVLAGTDIKAKWLQMVQDELVYVVETAGLTLDDQDNTQLHAAILQLISNYAVLDDSITLAKMEHGGANEVLKYDGAGAPTRGLIAIANMGANSVGTSQIVDDSVTLDKIASGGAWEVLRFNLGGNPESGKINQSMLQDDVVGLAQLEAGAPDYLLGFSTGVADPEYTKVETRHFAAGAVDTAALAADAVTLAKMEHGTVNQVLTYGASGVPQRTQVQEAMIADDAVTAAKVADNAIAKASIQDGAVTNTKVGDNQIGPAKISHHTGYGAVVFNDLGVPGYNKITADHIYAAAVRAHMPSGVARTAQKGYGSMGTSHSTTSVTFIRGTDFAADAAVIGVMTDNANAVAQLDEASDPTSGDMVVQLVAADGSGVGSGNCRLIVINT